MTHRRARKSPLIVVDVSLLEQCWQSEMTGEQIAGVIGVKKWQLPTIREEAGLPKRPSFKSYLRPWDSKKRPKEPDPEVSPEEVQHRIAKVQARWTDEVFVLRSLGRARPVPYEFPRYSIQ